MTEKKTKIYSLLCFIVIFYYIFVSLKNCYCKQDNHRVIVVKGEKIV